MSGMTLIPPYIADEAPMLCDGRVVHHDVTMMWPALQIYADMTYNISRNFKFILLQKQHQYLSRRLEISYQWGKPRFRTLVLLYPLVTVFLKHTQ